MPQAESLERQLFAGFLCLKIRRNWRQMPNRVFSKPTWLELPIWQGSERKATESDALSQLLTIENICQKSKDGFVWTAQSRLYFFDVAKDQVYPCARFEKWGMKRGTDCFRWKKLWSTSRSVDPAGPEQALCCQNQRDDDVRTISLRREGLAVEAKARSPDDSQKVSTKKTDFACNCIKPTLLLQGNQNSVYPCAHFENVLI